MFPLLYDIRWCIIPSTTASASILWLVTFVCVTGSTIIVHISAFHSFKFEKTFPLFLIFRIKIWAPLSYCRMNRSCDIVSWHWILLWRNVIVGILTLCNWLDCFFFFSYLGDSKIFSFSWSSITNPDCASN